MTRTSTSFLSIPLDDIKKLLSFFHLDILYNSNNLYLSAWSFILANNNSTLILPTSIVDWIISYNLSQENIEIPIVSSSSILFSNNIDLKNLSIKLTLPNVNKERILRILYYLQKLNNNLNVLDTLPLDILKIILKKLDCESLFLICKLSKNLNKFFDNGYLKQIIQDKTKFDISKYNKIKDLKRICKTIENNNNKHISAGYRFSLILTSDGKV